MGSSAFGSFVVGRMPENTAFAVIISLNLNAHLFLFHIGLCVRGHSLGLWAESVFCQHGENESECFVIHSSPCSQS